jgi:hypothetical protein
MSARLTRRGLGGSAVLLAIAGMTPAAAADLPPASAAPHPDTELLRLCAEFEATEHRITGIYDGPDRIINDDEADRLAEPLEAHRDVLLADMAHSLPRRRTASPRVRGCWPSTTIAVPSTSTIRTRFPARCWLSFSGMRENCRRKAVQYEPSAAAGRVTHTTRPVRPPAGDPDPSGCPRNHTPSGGAR